MTSLRTFLRSVTARRHRAEAVTLMSETNDRTSNFDYLRLVAQVFLTVLVLVLPTEADSLRLLAIFVIGLLSIGLSILVLRSSRIQDSVTAHNLLAALLAAVFAALIPSLWPAMLVYFCVLVIAAAAVRVRAATILALALGTVLFAMTGQEAGLSNWPTNLTIAALTVIGITIYYTLWFQARNETDLRYEQLTEHARVFFWEVDQQSLEIRDVNGGTSGALGWSRAEVIGTQAEQFLMTEAARDACAALVPNEEREALVPMRHRDGRTVQIHSHFWATADGTIRGTGLDVTEVREATRTIRWQSRHDVLTGLPNRDSLHDWLDQLLTDRAGDEPGIALLMLDLDRFKDVNDTLGHGVGDGLLCVLAERFTSRLGKGVRIARVGGDEFGFVIVNTELHRSQIRRIAEDIAGAVRATVSLDGLSLTVSASIGISIADSDSTATELVRQADIAMYESKRTNSRYSFFAHEQQRFSAERLQLAAEVGAAIKAGDLRLWLQKKVDAQSGRTVGAEGLARWEHPEHGVLTPAAFLDLIEISDAHEAFADLVLREGVRLARRCREIDPDFVMSINMTPRSLTEPTFPRRLATLLVEEGVPPQALTIEVTEREILDDVDGMLDGCRTLNAMGTTISIDDFGTGWSSLERLRQLPVSEVKIDRSFVARVTTNEQDRTIVRSIIDLSDSLGLDCVAEGVEEQEQAEALTELGCRTLQGYRFARAVPETDFVADLRKG